MTSEVDEIIDQILGSQRTEPLNNLYQGPWHAREPEIREKQIKVTIPEGYTATVTLTPVGNDATQFLTPSLTYKQEPSVKNKMPINQKVKNEQGGNGMILPKIVKVSFLFIFLFVFIAGISTALIINPTSYVDKTISIICLVNSIVLLIVVAYEGVFKELKF